jgi:hypothetical protein
MIPEKGSVIFTGFVTNTGILTTIFPLQNFNKKVK